MSSATSPVVIGTIPSYVSFVAPISCRFVLLRTTERTPAPTAAPTFSLPSGLSGGSACGWFTYPFTRPW